MGLLQSITASEFWQKHIYLNFIAEDRWKYLTTASKTPSSSPSAR